MTPKTVCLVLFTTGLLMGGVPVPAQLAAAPPLAAEMFFKGSVIEGAKLSPSGQWLAMTATIGTRVGLVVADLKNWGQLKTLAHFSNVDVADFHWVNEERLVFDVHQKDRGSRDQAHSGGLLAVGRDGGDLRLLIETLFPGAHGLSITRPPLQRNHFLLQVPRAGTGDEVVVGEASFRAGELRSVVPKRLNVNTGRAVYLEGARPEENTVGWLFDRQGQPRVAVTRSQARVRYHWRQPGQGHWALLGDFDWLNRPYVPEFVDDKGDLFVSAPTGLRGAAELKRFDHKALAPQADALVSAPGFDILAALATDPDSDRVLGVHVNTDAYTAVWFDPVMKALQAEADKRLPGHVNRIACRRCGQPDMTALVHSWSDRDPGQYWVYRAAAQDWLKVGSARPGVDPQRMAVLDFHRISARDGRDLPLWLTLPAGHKKGDRPPVVVLVHGGPWVRGGYWAWDPMPQFLASRGYAVIEPEFRGSMGYGSEHFKAGFKQWGLAMQDDVADALQWARRQGLVDTERACIAGASYGGYAALMGPIRHPGLYRCAIAWVAVTDPLLLHEWMAESDSTEDARRYGIPAMVGDKVADAELLKAASPVARAAELKLPLILGFGAEDRRVPLVHGTRLRDALKAQGREPEWVVYPGEGHGGWTLEHKLDWAGRMERFLARHLK